ncbi:MAG: murein L,D-transpeptidase catalytic domain family protein [Gammaproteobacteria bacterium]|nr:murein L,D-transpeptidase catalytic domain family protein [Gammaproteobacteria bacterium]
MNFLIGIILMIFFGANIASNTSSLSNSGSNADINTEVKHLSQKAPELDTKILKYALIAYQKALSAGLTKKPILTVVDYSKPSSEQRLWVFDVNQEKLLFNTHVAHGQNSGGITPTHFSNQVSSKESSLGTYVTLETYMGSNGYSLNLKGLEKGINDNAYTRRVVVHGANYVEPNYIKSIGHAGRSWGCLAVAKTLSKSFINLIKDGSVIFAYYPDKQYISHSHYL